MSIPNENEDEERDEEANPGLCRNFFKKQRLTDVKPGFGLYSLQLSADPFVALIL